MTASLRHITKPSNLIIVLIVIYLLPIWLFDYFPTQDGVSHVYNAQIITEYNNPNYEFHHYYEVNWFPFPNWLSHISLALLMYIFPSLISEKIFLSIYIILFPIAIRYFLNSVQSNRDSLVILSFTFIYNYLLLMGFYNFAVSVLLFFLTLGYWWRHKDTLHIAKVVLLNVLIITIYFAHLISYTFCLFSISVIAVIHYRRNIKQMLLSVCSIIPAGVMLLIYLPSSDLTEGGLPSLGLGRIWSLLENMVGMRILIAFNQHQQWIAYGVFVVMVLLGIWTIWEHRKSASEVNTNNLPFLLLSTVLIALYMVLPNSIGPGGWVNDRILILTSLTILVCFRLGDNIRWNQLFLGVATVLAVANVIFIGILCQNLNKELRQFNAFVDKVENNSIILPLQFKPNGDSLRVGIFVNAANYYCLDNGCINLGNYEVQFDYFPIRFKPDFETPTDEKEWVQTVHWGVERIDLCGYADNVDYLLLWGSTENEKINNEIQECYEMIAFEKDLKLYKPKL